MLSPEDPDPTASLYASHPSVLADFLAAEVASALSPLLSLPAVSTALGVKRYGLEHVPVHLAHILPSHWAPVGIGGDAPMAVRWRDGAAVRF